MRFWTNWAGWASSAERRIYRNRFDCISGRLKRRAMEALDCKIPCQLPGCPGFGRDYVAGSSGDETLMARRRLHRLCLFPQPAANSLMYAGVGAKRVQDCLPKRGGWPAGRKSFSGDFIDELDVVGAKRGRSSHMEYDQTLNQLLVELDGIEGQQDVRLFVWEPPTG